MSKAGAKRRFVLMGLLGVVALMAGGIYKIKHGPEGAAIAGAGAEGAGAPPAEAGTGS